MEFGIFLNGYIPGPGAHDSEWEHRQLMREAEYAIFADKHNWKYAWFGEHHALAEYSHMSAPEVIMGLRRRPDRPHPPRHRRSTASRPARSTPSATPSGPPCSTTSPATASSGAPAAAPAATRWPLQHPRQELHQGGVGRGRPRDPAHVGAGRLPLRGRALHRADPAQHPPEAVRHRPPADLGGVRQPADVHPGRRAGHRRHRLQLRADLQPEGPDRGLQGGHRRLHRAARAVHERQRDDDQRASSAWRTGQRRARSPSTG